MGWDAGGRLSRHRATIATLRQDLHDSYRRPAWLQVAIVRITALALVAHVVGVSLNAYTTSGWVDRWVIVTALLLLALSSVWVMVVAVRGTPDLRSVQGFAVADLLANVLVAAAPKHGVPPQGTPFVNGPMALAVFVAAVAFTSLRLTAGMVLALTTSYAAVRAPVVGWPLGLVEASTAVAGAVIVGLLTRSMDRTFATAERLSQERSALATASVRHEEHRRVRAAWDRLLHDKVLGALLLASRSTSFEVLATARQLAGDALRALGVVDGSHGPPVSISEAAREWHLTLEGDRDLPEGIPEEVHVALLTAVSEAFGNIVRHAGVTHARVKVTGDRDDLLVMVQDQGRGFDPSAATARFGISGSIRGHMATVDGTCEVHSAPGEGTSVFLGWQRPPPKVSMEDGSPSPLLRTPAYLMAIALWAVPSIAAGWASTRGVWPGVTGWPPAYPWLTGAMLVCLLLPLVGRAGTAPVSILGVAACVGWFAFLTPNAAHSDWRYWFVNLSLPLPVMWAMKRRPGVALWACAAISGGTLAGVAVDGDVALGIVEMLAVPWVITIPAVLGVRALDRARDSVAQEAQELLEMQRATHAAELESALAARRRDQLSRDVIPLLLRIWGREVLTHADRLEAALVEAGARDRLTGDSLVTDAVQDAARSARARGARVTLQASSDAATSAPLAAYCAVIPPLLDACGEGSRLIAQWNPDEGARIGTVSITAPALPVDEARVDATLRGIPHTLENRVDEIWLELAAPGAVPITADVADEPALSQ